MQFHTELFEPLLAGLPPADRLEVLRVLDRARDEQLDRKRNPRRRRRRDADGVLQPPPEAA